jgi:hypothetical protein
LEKSALKSDNRAPCCTSQNPQPVASIILTDT